MPYKVELIICGSDHTWFTDFIEISETSDNIGQEAIDTWTENYIARKQAKKTDLMLAYVGVYSIIDLEEEELDAQNLAKHKQSINDILGINENGNK